MPRLIGFHERINQIPRANKTHEIIWFETPGSLLMLSLMRLINQRIVPRLASSGWAWTGGFWRRLLNGESIFLGRGRKTNPFTKNLPRDVLEYVPCLITYVDSQKPTPPFFRANFIPFSALISQSPGLNPWLIVPVIFSIRRKDGLSLIQDFLKIFSLAHSCAPSVPPWYDRESRVVAC